MGIQDKRQKQMPDQNDEESIWETKKVTQKWQRDKEDKEKKQADRKDRKKQQKERQKLHRNLQIDTKANIERNTKQKIDILKKSINRRTDQTQITIYR